MIGASTDLASSDTRIDWPVHQSKHRLGQCIK